MSHRFSDAQLVVILQKAARRINRLLCLTGTADEIVIDTTTGEITPDDADLQDLVLLQSECMINQREYQEELATAAGGLRIVDGEQTVDTTSAGVARGTFFDSAHNPCAELKDQITQEKLNRGAGGGGKLVW